NWNTSIVDAGFVVANNNTGVVTPGYHVNIAASDVDPALEANPGYLGAIDSTGLLVSGTSPLIPKYLFCGTQYPIPVAVPGFRIYAGDYFEQALGPYNGDLTYTINAGLD